jgi:MFS family permease
LSTSAIFVMVDPIKDDLDLTDSQIGLLQGFGYVVLYVFLGLAVGRLVDRTSRRAIVAVGAVVWSFMTLACGLSQNFWQLFLARSGVGAGEASVAPAAYSILSDYFPPKRIGAALAVYSTGINWGQGLALLAGGILFTALSVHDFYSVPILGELRPWQMVLVCLSPPGVIVAVLMATVKEPKRRGLRASEQHSAGLRSVPLRDVVRYVACQKSAYLAIIGGMSLQVVLGFGSATWTPTFFIRTYGLNPAEVGTTLGVLIVCVGSLGAFAAARFCTWLEDRGRADATMLTVLVGSVCSLPASIAYPIMPTAEGAFVVIAVSFFFSGFPFGAATAALNLITPNQMRGQIGAIYQLALNLIGVGMGPVAIGLLTDYVLRDEAQLRYSLFVAAIVIQPIAIALSILGLGPFRRARAAMEQWERA